jgi:membrane protein required for colicin V production
VTPVEFVIVFICVISAGIGLWRGFVKEALSLLTLLAAIWLAWRFAGLVAPALGDWAGSPEVRIWSARVIVFVLVLVAGGLISWLARMLVRHSGLSGVDRVLGAGFGFVRAILVVGLAVIVLEFLELDQDGWWQQARLRPYAEEIAAAVRYYAELGQTYLRGEAAA